MSDLGKIAITDGGMWDSEITYEQLTIVRHNSASWMSTADSTGQEPSEDSEYWRLIAKDGVGMTGAPVLIQEDTPTDTSALWVW